MVTLSTTAAFLAGSVMALWLAASAWALATGLSLQRRVGRSSDQADRLAILLDGAPASPLLVRQNGKIEAQPRLMSWLGLARMPEKLADLSTSDAGLTAQDLVALEEDIAAARKTARSFTRSFVPQKGNRTLLAKGALASSRIAGPKAVTIWCQPFVC
jgi:hypothetical protein